MRNLRNDHKSMIELNNNNNNNNSNNNSDNNTATTATNINRAECKV